VAQHLWESEFADSTTNFKHGKVVKKQQHDANYPGTDALTALQR